MRLNGSVPPAAPAVILNSISFTPVPPVAGHEMKSTRSDPAPFATVSGYATVVVPIPTLPKKYEVALVVAIKFPTVSCVPVAIRLPDELVVIIELAANVVALNTCDASVDVEIDNTNPFEPRYVKPCNRDGKKNADPNVDDAVENRPLNPMTVDVEL